MGSSVLFLGILVFLCATDGTLVHGDYTAAVFEHRHRHDIDKQTPKEVIQTNLEFYEKAAQLSAAKGVDILVFNEYGLFPYITEREVMRQYMETVPDPRQSRHNPCLEEKFKDSLILSTISCMARKYKMYIVANTGDIHECESESQTCDANDIENCQQKCPEDGVYMYNTDVAFDREGNLVARYHKVHPYFEVVNRPDGPEFVTFKTDFGTFGLIICFDSVFKEALLLAKNHGIDTLIFSTFWYDEIVPFNAVEWQQSWAIANKVNFLGANSQTPGSATLGSGIYSKDSGAIVYTYEPDGESKLLIGKLSSTGSDVEPGVVFVVTENSNYVKGETGDGFPLYGYDKLVGPPKDIYTDYRYYKSQTENHTLVKLAGAKGEVKSCDGSFCCSLTYSADDMSEDYYLALRNFENDVEGFYHWCEETCMLVRCDSFEDRPCVIQPSQSKTVFNSLELGASFTSEIVYATVSKSKHRLAPKREWKYKRNEDGTVLKFKTDSKDPLLKAGLFGRCYDRDVPFTPWF